MQDSEMNSYEGAERSMKDINNSKSKRVPKLRFPEFRDAPEWEKKKLSELLSRKPEYGLNAPATSYTDTLPTYLRITDISEDGRFIRENKVSVDIETTDNNYLEVGDIALARTGASVGKSYKHNPDDGMLVFAGFLIRIRPNPEKLNSIFLFNFLFTDEYWEWVAVTSVRGGQPGINGNEYGSLLVPIPPSLPEQQRIADCLSSLDEWIAAEAERLDALKEHKKGLMQQLFPAEGETTPKLRFPEFRHAGKWKKIDLGSIGKISMCKRILKGETSTEGDIPFYKIGTFGKKADAYIDREIFEIYRSKYPYPRKGEILISASGTIGRLVVFDGVDAYFQDSNIVWIQNDENLVNNGFLFYCYENIKWATADNTISRLYNDNLRAMEILIASSFEQHRIADCLSSLDELIAAQSNKLNALKDHKKALMQQLFPSSKEGNT